MKVNRKSILENRGTLLLIFAGIMIVYFCYSMLVILITFNIELLKRPLVLFTFAEYGLLVFIGINFFRNKPFAWYGMASLFLIQLYINLFLIFGLIVYLFFGEDLSSLVNMKLPALKMNWRLIRIFIEFIIYLLLLKLALNKDTLIAYGLDERSKVKLISGIVVLSLTGVLIYFGGTIIFMNKGIGL